MKIAAFTMGFNEAVFLPLWRKHYEPVVGADNLFYIDHSSTEVKSLGPGTNSITVPRGLFDEPNRAFSVSHFHSFLLGFYDVVIFSDTDEFLVADPDKFSSLREFIEARPAPRIAALGFDVLHFPDEEPPLDFTRPLLAQRRFARLENIYCKTLIAREPVEWTPGFHHVRRHEAAYDPDLFLLHLKYMDAATFEKHQSIRSAIEWSERSLKVNHGRQWRQDPMAAVRSHFGGRPPVNAPELIDLDPGASVTEWLAARAATKPLYRIPAKFHSAIAPAGEGATALPAQDAARPLQSAPGPEHRSTDVVADVNFGNKTTHFHISNPKDHIQSILKAGSFYEIQQLMFHQEVIARGMIVLDIGANIGNHSIFYAQHTGAARVVPFEPNPAANSILRKNVSLNSTPKPLAVDLTYLETALSDRRGRLQVSSSPNNNLGGTTFRGAETTASDTVMCMPLDDLPFRSGVGFMKIDVEGMEMSVLRGASETIAANRPIIFIEINKNNEPAFWQWLDENRYCPIFAAHNYPTVKNYLVIPKS